MEKPTAAEATQGLLREQAELLATKARLSDRLSDTNARLKVVDACIEGIRLGQRFAGEAQAAEAGAKA